MKKLILLLIVTTSSFSQSQFRLNKKESCNLSIILEPNTSIVEKGLFVGVEIEYSGSIYARAGINNFSVLEDGYTEILGGIGANFTSGYDNNIRYYLGGRLGVIKRQDVNAMFGAEIGLDFKITDDIFIGGRATYDYRSDKEFYDYPRSMDKNIFLRIGVNL